MKIRTMEAKKRISEFRRGYPLLYNIVLIVLILLALALVSALLMNIGTRHGSHRTVPDFTGVKLQQAQRDADRSGLEIIVNDSLFVPAYEGGIVLDQLPKGGVEVKAGRKVYVTINSFRQKMVKIPYVAGRSLRQAKNMLELAGLGIDRLVYVEDMATNYVLEEFFDGVQIMPESRLQAEMGSGVTLRVGVEGGYGVTGVPKLIGMSLQRASSRLWELGLNVGSVSYDADVDLLDRNDARVYYQSLDQGTSAALGSDVTLRLTTDAVKVEKCSAESDRAAQDRMDARLAEEARTDSLRRAGVLPEGEDPARSEGAVQERSEDTMQNEEDFFL